MMTGLCQRCTEGAIVQDDPAHDFNKEIYEHGSVVLRHSALQGEDTDNNSDPGYEPRVDLGPGIHWFDMAPDFPHILASATGAAETGDGGCQMCAFVHAALLQRQLDHHGAVMVKATYVWGYGWDKDMNLADSFSSLSHMKCEVFAATTISRTATAAAPFVDRGHAADDAEDGAEDDVEDNPLLAWFVFFIEAHDGASAREDGNPHKKDHFANIGAIYHS